MGHAEAPCEMDTSRRGFTEVPTFLPQSLCSSTLAMGLMSENTTGSCCLAWKGGAWKSSKAGRGLGLTDKTSQLCSTWINQKVTVRESESRLTGYKIRHGHDCKVGATQSRPKPSMRTSAECSSTRRRQEALLQLLPALPQGTPRPAEASQKGFSCQSYLPSRAQVLGTDTLVLTLAESLTGHFCYRGYWVSKENVGAENLL